MSKAGESEDNGVIMNVAFEEVSKTVSGLIPATLYDLVMYVETDLSESEHVHISFSTAPGGIPFPEVSVLMYYFK